MQSCTRCAGTGFINIDGLPDGLLDNDCAIVLSWIASHPDTDAQVCDCCGNGHDWYGEPGYHYTSQDPAGRNGPYAYNGGLCECN